MVALLHRLSRQPCAGSLRPDIERLLAAFGSASAIPREDRRSKMEHGIEVLTEREMEVLRLLAEGRSNQAIANELIVAVGTVKRHVNSILGKLEVQSRLEAVTRARGLGLI